MKRGRDEILNDIDETDNLIKSYKAGILREKKNLLKYTIDLDNCDIDQHKADTIKQFDKWKEQFCEHHKDHRNIKTVKRLLDSYSLMHWKPKCYMYVISGIRMRFYSNK